jgi:hypothetical protein
MPQFNLAIGLTSHQNSKSAYAQTRKLSSHEMTTRIIRSQTAFHGSKIVAGEFAERQRGKGAKQQTQKEKTAQRAALQTAQKAYRS